MNVEEAAHTSTDTLRYETKDIRPIDVVRGAIALLVFTGVTSVVSLGILLFLRSNVAAGDKKPGPLALQHREGDFPSPRLQHDPTGDLLRHREQEKEVLNAYGWVDPQANRVRMPIEHAVRVLVHRGLPVQLEGGTPAPAASPGSSPAPAAPPASLPTEERPLQPPATLPPAGGH